MKMSRHMKLSCLWVQLGLLMDCLFDAVYIYIIFIYLYLIHIHNYTYIYLHLSLYLYIAIGYGGSIPTSPSILHWIFQPCHRGEARAPGTWWTAVLHRRSGSSGPGTVRGSVLADHLETTLTPKKSHSELENIRIFNRWTNSKLTIFHSALLVYWKVHISIYVYIYICLYVYVYTYTCIYMYTCVHVYIYIYIPNKGWM